MNLELIPFDPVKAAHGAQVMTRDFRKVDFEVYNPRLKEPVRCRAIIGSTLNPLTFFENGRRVLEKETKDDLFLTAPRTIEGEAEPDVQIVALVVDMASKQKGGKRTVKKMTPEQFGHVATPEQIAKALKNVQQRTRKEK
jgi:hypothetical protein